MQSLVLIIVSIAFGNFGKANFILYPTKRDSAELILMQLF